MKAGEICGSCVMNCSCDEEEPQYLQLRHYLTTSMLPGWNICLYRVRCWCIIVGECMTVDIKKRLTSGRAGWTGSWDWSGLCLALSCSEERETWLRSGALDWAALQSVDSGMWRDQNKNKTLFPKCLKHMNQTCYTCPPNFHHCFLSGLTFS